MTLPTELINYLVPIVAQRNSSNLCVMQGLFIGGMQARNIIVKVGELTSACVAGPVYHDH